jgi:hypothetical protein
LELSFFNKDEISLTNSNFAPETVSLEVSARRTRVGHKNQFSGNSSQERILGVEAAELAEGGHRLVLALRVFRPRVVEVPRMQLKVTSYFTLKITSYFHIENLISFPH